MRKYLIINADDFGLDDSCSEAILELAQKNLISSTTILANFVKPSLIERLIKIKGISTGLHVNLIEGTPLSKASEVKTLTDKNGKFYPASKLFLRYIAGLVSAEEIDLEIKAQINQLLKYSVVISHADSHQHVHKYPFLGNVITNSLKQNGITTIRKCNLSSYQSIRMAVLYLFHLISAKYDDVISPDVLIPTFSIEKEANLPAFQKGLSQGFRKGDIVEFMTHPSLNNDPDSYLNKRGEYSFWMNANWKEYLEKSGIELISFTQFKELTHRTIKQNQVV